MCVFPGDALPDGQLSRMKTSHFLGFFLLFPGPLLESLCFAKPAQAMVLEAKSTPGPAVWEEVL